mgnify:CR=1 FL=1
MKVLITIAIILLFNKYVYSNNLFDTSIHDVNFISNNIENTKIIKINEIKNKSLLNILKKTLSNEKYDELLTDLSDDLINSFIKNVIINDEKIINNKYISKIKINFNKKKIVEFYRKKNIPYVEYYPKKFLLIIYEEDEISENLFTKNNNFYSYYNQNIETISLFRIPNLDINDRFLLKKEHIKNRDYEKISKVTKLSLLDEMINSLPKPVIMLAEGAAMAGGLGMRLRPLTENLPKPMISIGDKPLLERIITCFQKQGFYRFTLSLNYLGHIIREHFGDGADIGVKIDYVEENKRMGTGGALSLLPKYPEVPPPSFDIIPTSD